MSGVTKCVNQSPNGPKVRLEIVNEPAKNAPIAPRYAAKSCHWSPVAAARDRPAIITDDASSPVIRSPIIPPATAGNSSFISAKPHQPNTISDDRSERQRPGGRHRQPFRHPLDEQDYWSGSKGQIGRRHRLESAPAVGFISVRKATPGIPACELKTAGWKPAPFILRTLFTRAESGSPAPVVAALSVSCAGEIASAGECYPGSAMPSRYAPLCSA